MNKTQIREEILQTLNQTLPQGIDLATVNFIQNNPELLLNQVKSLENTIKTLREKVEILNKL